MAVSFAELVHEEVRACQSNVLVVPDASSRGKESERPFPMQEQDAPVAVFVGLSRSAYCKLRPFIAKLDLKARCIDASDYSLLEELAQPMSTFELGVDSGV